MLFIVQWPSGRVSSEVSEVKSLDAYAMQRWGFNSIKEVEEGFNVRVIMQDGDTEPTSQEVKEALVREGKHNAQLDADEKHEAILAAKAAVADAQP